MTNNAADVRPYMHISKKFHKHVTLNYYRVEIRSTGIRDSLLIAALIIYTYELIPLYELRSYKAEST